MESIKMMELTIRNGEETYTEPCEVGFICEPEFDPSIDYIYGLCSLETYDRAMVVESDEKIIERAF